MIPMVRTMLGRLVRKKVLTFRADGKIYHYRPLVTRQHCVRMKSRSLLERVFGGGAYSWSLLGVFLLAILSALCLTTRKSDAADTSDTPHQTYLGVTPPPNQSNARNSPGEKDTGALPFTIDLKPYFDDVFHDPAGSDSAYLGYAGRKTIDGLPFNIDGNIPLFGKTATERNNNYPEDVPGIKIGRKFDELHLVHAARWREYYGCPIAVIRLHYAGGTTYDFTIRDKFHVDDWSRLETENDEVTADPDTKIIWRGPGSAKGTGRLFKSMFRNPFPGLKVDTMELISTHSAMSYVLVAATIAKKDPNREVTPPMPLLVSNPRFDGKFNIHVVDQTTGKPLAGAEINVAWITDNISLVADSVVTSDDGIATVKFPKVSTQDLRVQVIKDGYVTCNDNWEHGWDGPSVPDKITYQLMPGQNPGSAAPVNPADSKIQISDEGRIYHALVYEQTSADALKLVTNPYQFIADIRNTIPNSKGTVSLPSGAIWPTNPVTVVTPASLAGSHFLYARGFASMANLLANFPNGNYVFNIGRTYAGGFSTSYTVPVTFTDSVKIPSAAPTITNTTWKSGALLLQLSSAIIKYHSASGATLSWEVIGNNMSLGGVIGPASGRLDLTGILQPGQTYQVQLRFINPDSSVIAADPDAPAGESNYAYTYSTLAATIVNFTITTPPSTTSTDPKSGTGAQSPASNAQVRASNHTTSPVSFN